jgi:predicted RNase H-like nuclease (RuvC/YqgF family)
MKRIIIGIEINEDQEAILKHAARIVNKETISDYCRRKIFAPVLENKEEAINGIKNTNDYLAEIKTLKADVEKLQSDKEDCDKKIKEQQTEIATLTSDLETLQNNSKNTAIQKLAKQAQEIKEQAKEINSLSEQVGALTDELTELQNKTFVSPSDLHLPLTEDEHKFVDLVMATYDEKIKNLLSKKSKGAINKDILFMMEKTEKYLPEEYQNPGSDKHDFVQKLREKLTSQTQAEN